MMLKNKINSYLSHNKITPTIIGVLVLLYSLLPICMGERFVFPNQVQIIVVMAYVAVLTSGYLLFRAFFFSPNRKIQVSHIDIILFIYAIYNICLFLFHYHSIEQEVLFENLSLFALYILFRNIKTNHIIYLLLALPITGAIQIAYGIKYQANNFDPGYGFSDIIGIFFNSGIFGGFIATVFIATIGVAIFLSDAIPNKSKYKLSNYLKPLLILALLVFFIQLIASNSRAAWCACSTSILYLIGSRLGLFNWFAKLSRVKRWLLTILSITLVCVFLSYLYGLKNKSADGRILIWKISSGMIKDTPLFGRGATGFQSSYMEYQAAYFKTHTQSPFSNLADDNIYAFNEFVRIWVEQGIIGLLLIFILLYYLFFKTKGESNISSDLTLITTKASIISMLVFGFFSYPANIFQFNLMFIFFLAAVSSLSIKKKNIVFSNHFSYLAKFKTIYPTISKVGIISVWLILAINLIPRIHKFEAVSKLWNDALKNYDETEPAQSINMLEVASRQLKNNGIFYSTYGKALNLSKHYAEAVPILLRANLLLPSAANYIELGKSYAAIGKYDNAKKAWTKASNMIPSMFTPHYLTAKMDWQIGKISDAQQIAEYLLRKEVKIRSPILYDMLTEMDSLVNIRE